MAKGYTSKCLFHRGNVRMKWVNAKEENWKCLIMARTINNEDDRLLRMAFPTHKYNYCNTFHHNTGLSKL